MDGCTLIKTVVTEKINNRESSGNVETAARIIPKQMAFLKVRFLRRGTNAVDLLPVVFLWREFYVVALRSQSTGKTRAVPINFKLLRAM
jgi:hypothetical protein